MARPTLYRAEYAGKALALCRLGVDKSLLARFFAVSTATLYHWLLAHPDFAAVVEAGAAEATSPIKPTLFQRATGYQMRVARVFVPRRRGAAPVVGYYTRRVLADPKVAFRWLRNRRPEEWGLGHKKSTPIFEAPSNKTMPVGRVLENGAASQNSVQRIPG